MKASSYYYDIDITSLTNMPYIEALKVKLESAKLVRNALVSQHYSVRDNQRLNQVLKAIKLAEFQLKEIEDAM